MARTERHPKKPENTRHCSGGSLAASVGFSGNNYATLHEFLDSPDPPFKVVTSALSPKRSREGVKPQVAAGHNRRKVVNVTADAHHLTVQSDLFEEGLAVQYEVQPFDVWKSLRRYKRFTVGSETIAIGEFILVKHDGTDDSAVDSSSDWKAKVLEVRALDSEHVYICVSWLNRPEDIAGGRQDYHGKNELVPTNQMDIIDAMTVNGTFHLKRWNEIKDIDRDGAFGKDVYYWEQTFDFTRQRLSKRRGEDSARLEKRLGTDEYI